MTRELADLAYNATQGLDLHLVNQPGRPLVVCLHGGGFWSGDKRDERCSQTTRMLSEAGFNCASVNYSLASRENRFSMWPRNLCDVADALVWLHDRAETYGYDFSRLGMLGFSAGCCLANLYSQGGSALFDHFGYRTGVFKPLALAGFYGPYDFPSRQAERRSGNPETDRYHSPSHWLRQNRLSGAPPVLHIQGDCDTVVCPDQHQAFQKDYQLRGYDFKAVIATGFGHAFAPLDSNAAGESIDLRAEITEFFSQHLKDGTG